MSSKKSTDKKEENNIIILVGVASIALFGLSQIAAGQIIKYSCSGDPDYICIQDTNGIYSLQECQNICGIQYVTVDIIINE